MKQKQEVNFEDLWITLQQNVYPVMIDCLAEELGVTVESIKRAGVGFYPLKQAWVSCERNENGQVIGLTQRYKIKGETKKVCWEGSKRGLSYECLGIREKKRYQRKNNFIRIHDANITCPICGKNDWCLVSDDNIRDPSVVICPRNSKNAERFIEGSGYLHRRKKTKDNSRLANSILSDTNNPLVVVEGYSDMLAAMDMGYVAVGKPSAEGGNGLLAKLLKNKDVIIIGENDEAGLRGMESTFQTLKPKCKSVIKILPPDKFKDLREWYPTADEFEAWVRKNKITKTADGTFETIHFPPLALEFLKKLPKLDCFEGDWFNWINGIYEKLPEDQLDKIIDEFFDGKPAVIGRGEQKTIQTLYTNEKFRREIKACLRSQCSLHPPLGVYEPFYIGTKKQIDLTRSIVFRNGIYHVLENRFEALSSDIFITSTLPYDYKPNAKCNLWLWFIEDVFNGDEQCINLLQEWLGYNLIASNHMEQMMFLFGVPGSGKSTVVSVLEALLGPDRYYAMDIEQFTIRFGLESLIGKYALIISDDSETDKKKLNKLLNRFKRITGQDTMNINRRYRQSINIKPTWRVTYAGNDLPEFSDEPQALLRRLNLLYFANNYYKTQDGPDRTLKNRLVKEVQGIAMWAIEGLQRLLQNDYFTQPIISLHHIEDYSLFVNPLRAMVEECCKVYEKPAEAVNHQTPRDWLFELHKVWYEENNLKSLGRASFGMKFHHLGLPQSVRKKRIMEQGERVWVYEGIEILPGVFKKYLGGGLK